MAEPLLPLDVMLHAMREFYEQENWKAAADIARAAAPYVHPRVTAEAGFDDIATMGDEQLAALLEAGGGRAVHKTAHSEEFISLGDFCSDAAEPEAGGASCDDAGGAGEAA